MTSSAAWPMKRRPHEGSETRSLLALCSESNRCIFCNSCLDEVIGSQVICHKNFTTPAPEESIEGLLFTRLESLFWLKITTHIPHTAPAGAKTAFGNG